MAIGGINRVGFLKLLTGDAKQGDLIPKEGIHPP